MPKFDITVTIVTHVLLQKKNSIRLILNKPVVHKVLNCMIVLRVTLFRLHLYL